MLYCHLLPSSSMSVTGLVWPQLVPNTISCSTINPELCVDFKTHFAYSPEHHDAPAACVIVMTWFLIPLQTDRIIRFWGVFGTSSLVYNDTSSHHCALAVHLLVLEGGGGGWSNEATPHVFYPPVRFCRYKVLGVSLICRYFKSYETHAFLPISYIEGLRWRGQIGTPPVISERGITEGRQAKQTYTKYSIARTARHSQARTKQSHVPTQYHYVTDCSSSESNWPQWKTIVCPATHPATAATGSSLMEVFHLWWLRDPWPHHVLWCTQNRTL